MAFLGELEVIALTGIQAQKQHVLLQTGFWRGGRPKSRLCQIKTLTPHNSFDPESPRFPDE